MSQTTERQDKDKNAKLDYTFAWATFVDADADTIASATVESTPTGLDVGSVTNTTSTVRCFASGGAEGTTYAVICHIWTAGGRQEDKVLELTITQVPSSTQTLVVEDGSGLETANSYATVAEADTYHASHLYASAWHQANTATKEKALIWATRLLDEQVQWHGTKTTKEQALLWPRYGTRDRGHWAIDGDEVPSEVKNATAELARLLITTDRTAEVDTLGFTRIKAGSLEMEIDKSDRRPVIPQTVRAMVGHLGSGGGGRFMRLVRT